MNDATARQMFSTPDDCDVRRRSALKYMPRDLRKQKRGTVYYQVKTKHLIVWPILLNVGFWLDIYRITLRGTLHFLLVAEKDANIDRQRVQSETNTYWSQAERRDSFNFQRRTRHVTVDKVFAAIQIFGNQGRLFGI